MKVDFYNFGIYHVDVAYLKYLHDVDSQVYYAVYGYKNKPFLGITVGIGRYTYFIPFTSSKPKHLKWSNVAMDHYLIYEYADRDKLSEGAICRPIDGRKVMHIIAALDIKKMIPVPDGLYEKIDIDRITNPAGKARLQKEYRFCRRNQFGILERVARIYEQQKAGGKIHRYYCNYSLLEGACEAYGRGGGETGETQKSD